MVSTEYDTNCSYWKSKDLDSRRVLNTRATKDAIPAPDPGELNSADQAKQAVEST